MRRFYESQRRGHRIEPRVQVQPLHQISSTSQLSSRRTHSTLRQARPWEKAGRSDIAKGLRATCSDGRSYVLTRAPIGTDFAEGILPLGSSLEIVWKTITGIPKHENIRRNLERLRRDGVPDHQYNLKVGAQLHSGPYGMLVREAAFHPKSMGNHDYLALPEIVEDICNGYHAKFGVRIHGEISTGLQKCIVKFEAPIESGHDLIEPSLLYCWKTIHGQALSFDANTCFNGYGVPVPRSMIRSIEFLQGPDLDL